MVSQRLEVCLSCGKGFCFGASLVKSKNNFFFKCIVIIFYRISKPIQVQNNYNPCNWVLTMKFNSCWKGLNGPNAFGSASDWIGQWIIKHPSKLSVSDWKRNYRVSEISQAIPKHNILTNTHTFLSHRNPMAIRIMPCLPNIIPAAFTLNSTSTQSLSKVQCSWSWKKITDTETLRWDAAFNCSHVYGNIPPTERMCDG